MLHVQKFLHERGLDALQQELAIKAVAHPDEPLVILNYDQIDSPKAHPVVRECRGITLERDTWKVVARAFDRFFNWGEQAHELARFDWTDCVCQTKEDGSLILVYHHGGRWRVNTRASFGQDVPRGAPTTWAGLVWEHLHADRLDPALTYVFELVGPYNTMVRRYREPGLFLLTAFAMGGHVPAELPFADLPAVARQAHLTLPEQHRFGSIDAIRAWLGEKEAADPTFEGVVVRDRASRWKVKNRTYLGMHHLTSGAAIDLDRYLLPFVLAGEDGELLAYFPEVRDRYLDLQARVAAQFEGLKAVWQDTRDLADQKDFARAVLARTRLAAVLFALRKRLPPDRQTEAELRAQWRAAEPLILKNL